MNITSEEAEQAKQMLNYLSNPGVVPNFSAAFFGIVKNKNDKLMHVISLMQEEDGDIEEIREGGETLTDAMVRISSKIKFIK